VEKPPDAGVKAFFAAAREANLRGMTCLTPRNYVDLSAYAPVMGVKYPPTDSVEILSGLTVGERFVVKGGFTLKAQLSKAAFGDGHGH